MATTKRTRSLPKNPSEEYLRKEAKRVARDEAIQLAAAQRKLAAEYGHRNWTELMRHVKSLSAKAEDSGGTDAVAEAPPLDELLNRSIEDLPLSMRTHTALQQEDINLIAELVRWTEQDLLQIKNFGRKSLDEIKTVLADMGLSLETREPVLPFLPLRELIAFPHVVYPVFVARPMSIEAIKWARNYKSPIAMAAQKDPAIENPVDVDIYRTGVVGTVIKIEDQPDGTLKALIEGRRRVRITRLITSLESFAAETEALTESAADDYVPRLLSSVASAFVVSRFKSLAGNLSTFVTGRGNPSVIADRVASYLPIPISEKQELLELLNPADRLRRLLTYLQASG